MNWRAGFPVLLAGWALGCSDGEPSSSVYGAGGSGATASPTGSEGGAVSTTAPSAGGSGGGAAATLPNGSREYGGVLNLVSPSGPTAIERYLSTTDPNVTLSELTQIFYESYPDEYDFIIFVLPYQLPIETTATFASFDVVNRPVIPGTGIERVVAERDFGSRGRLKGVFGTQGDPAGGRPPFAHELGHYWANYLDNAAFGFGADLDYDYGAHWGHIGVYGQLGGFDPSTLACAAPAGALPPDCSAEADGRIRYTMSAFGANTNSFKGVDFAALELYLMGLIPVEEVPDPILVLEQPQYVAIDVEADTATVEAAGIDELSLSEIVARHGARAATPEGERQLSAAFVVVSESPLDDATMTVFAEWSDVLGNHVPSSKGHTSFESKTGGRMSLSTRLGRRRTPDDP